MRNEEYFIAEGNVFIQNGIQMLIAERLEYNYKTKKISLEGKIKFNAKDQFLEAQNLSRFK